MSLQDPKNTVLVVSGSGRKVLKRAFKGLQHVGLAGENGFFFKWGKPVASDNAASDSGTEAEEEGDDDQEPAADDPRGLAMRGWNILHEHLDVSWLEIAEHIMEIYSAVRCQHPLPPSSTPCCCTVCWPCCCG